MQTMTRVQAVTHGVANDEPTRQVPYALLVLDPFLQEPHVLPYSRNGCKTLSKLCMAHG